MLKAGREPGVSLAPSHLSEEDRAKLKVCTKCTYRDALVRFVNANYFTFAR